MRCPLLIVTLFFALAGCRGDRGKCEKAVRNYADLVFWHRANDEIAKLPPEKRDQERKLKLAEYAFDVEQQTEFRIEQCVSSRDHDTIDCMIAAKTSEAALKCAPVAEDK